ncbi:MAG: DUF1045 domain-containing protein [Pseudomonadota bacterium]
MRYAIYYTPPSDHPLTQAATAWLGRDAFGSPVLAESHGYEALIASPRRYGFHGTLKAPFRLPDTVTEAELLAAFDAFLATPRPIPEVTLQVVALGSFIALVPAHQHDDDLRELASDCLQGFEPFRAPLTDAEIARRNPASLSSEQLGYLQRYGYPYVLDAFRFHMTLSGAVEDSDTRSQIKQYLEHRFGKLLTVPLKMNTLAVFIEEEPGADFQVLRFGELTASLKANKRVGNQ